LFFNINKIKSFFCTNIINTIYNSSNNIDENVEVARENKYDNLRGLAIILVVLGHLIPPFYGINSAHFIYNLVFVFHMPLFFFISGYFSRVSLDAPIKAFKRLFIPYIFFSILWMLFNYFVLNFSSDRIPFFNPEYGLWFLLSLFIMRFMLPILSKIRYIFWIALLIALFVGVYDFPKNFLGLTRTFCFLPIFLFGYNFENYKKIFQDKIIPKFKFIRFFNGKKIVFTILILFLIIVGVNVYGIPSDASQFVLSYHSMHMGNKIGIIQRTFIILSGIIISLLLCFVMTNRKMFLTKIGINSLAVYILHFYFTRFINVKIIPQLPGDFNDLIFWAYAIITTSVIVFILSRDTLTKLINKTMETISNKLLGI